MLRSLLYLTVREGDPHLTLANHLLPLSRQPLSRAASRGAYSAQGSDRSFPLAWSVMENRQARPADRQVSSLSQLIGIKSQGDSLLAPCPIDSHAGKIAAMHCPVFGCTPDQFPDLMAVALTGQDIEQWAASRDIALIRGV